MSSAYSFKNSFYLLIVALIIFSCRKEEIVLIESPEDNVLLKNSEVASLMQRISLNDGSKDNIVDEANCFTFKFPYEVVVNDLTNNITQISDLQTVEGILDNEDTDIDSVAIVFPITAILSDHSEVQINSSSELSSLINTCQGENQEDVDIECLDVSYPFDISTFNTNNELIEVLSIATDKELFQFIETLDTSIIANVDFPISVTQADGNSIMVDNLTMLTNIITSNISACDEDDDYDYNDDDCNTCTIDQLTNLLVNNCSDWIVKDLTRDNVDLEETYDGYLFNFFDDGTLSITSINWTWFGTWIPTGSGNNITVSINIPNLPDCNNDWVLQEIQTYNGEEKVDLQLNGERLRYITTCD